MIGNVFVLFGGVRALDNGVKCERSDRLVRRMFLAQVVFANGQALEPACHADFDATPKFGLTRGESDPSNGRKSNRKSRAIQEIRTQLSVLLQFFKP